MGRLLHHVSTHERIMLLRHGSDKGLFFRKDDSKDEYDKVIVCHAHAYHLRKHDGNIVAVWCNADKFARAEGLHGLFTNLIITDKREAQEHGIITLQMYIDDACYTMYSRLRKLLDDGAPLREIPQLMKEMYNSIIRKTKCSRVLKRNVSFPKTKRSLNHFFDPASPGCISSPLLYNLNALRTMSEGRSFCFRFFALGRYATALAFVFSRFRLRYFDCRFERFNALRFDDFPAEGEPRADIRIRIRGIAIRTRAR